jgi:hypothetical protein
METKFVEATQKGSHINWGKFMLGRWTEEEWQLRSGIGHGPLLHEVGWTKDHILVVDLQTGEGSVFKQGGLAKADLDKHQIWVCPMFEPFLQWLYTQDISNLETLPTVVELDTKDFALWGYRRKGPGKKKV